MYVSFAIYRSLLLYIGLLCYVYIGLFWLAQEMKKSHLWPLVLDVQFPPFFCCCVCGKMQR